MIFTASLLYKSSRSDDHAPLWEERLILLFAVDEGEARCRALEYAQEFETSFKEPGGALIEWKFDQIERIFAVDDGKLHDGTELFSRFLREKEVLSILSPFED